MPLRTFRNKSAALGQVLPQELGNFLDELDSLAIFFAGNVIGLKDTDCKVLGHEAILNSLNHRGFQGVTEVSKLIVVV